MAEIIDWQVGNGIEVKTTKEKVWTMKDEQEGPNKVWKWLGWGCSMSEMCLAFPAGMVQVHAVSFGS